MNKSNLLFSFISSVYLLYARKCYRHFINNLPFFREIQIELLKNIHHRRGNSDQEILDFHKNINIVHYELLPNSYHTAQKGDLHPVNNEIIKVIEPTSGSSGKKKRILYTKSTMKLFQKMFTIWSFDILTNHGPFKTGKTYISLSPRFAKEEDEGLESDQGYLNSFSQFILSPFILCPARVSHIKSNDDFFIVTALYFLSTSNLEIISVWSPSFLVSIINTFHSHKRELSESLTSGLYQTKCGQTYTFHCLNQRIDFFQKGAIAELFSSVRFISCWKLSSAVQDLAALKRFFPNAEIQAKGLLATESPLTIPVLKNSSSLPFYTQIFFDFREENGESKYLWELEKNNVYAVIFSHKGGLVKYCLGDLVKVTDFIKGVPVLEFFTRAGAVTDLVGEKITEHFLSEIHKNMGSNLEWILIPCITQENTKLYELFYEGDFMQAQQIKKAIESSYHFAHALQLKQLLPIALILTNSINEKTSLYFENKGIRRGDQKKTLLIFRENDRNLAKWLKDQTPS